MIIRELRKEEWSKAEEFFREQFNSRPPLPEISSIVVAEEAGQVVGMLAAQLVLHIEPLGVKESARSKYIVPQLINKMAELLPDAQYAFSTTCSGRIEKLLQKLGFKKMPWVIYRWQRGEQ